MERDTPKEPFTKGNLLVLEDYSIALAQYAKHLREGTHVGEGGLDFNDLTDDTHAYPLASRDDLFDRIQNLISRISSYDHSNVDKQ